MNEKPETIQTAADARHSMPRLVRLLAPITPDPLLLPKWEAHPTDETKIIGRWAEDFSLYEITVPHQLRDSILAMQHALPDLLPNVERTREASAPKLSIKVQKGVDTEAGVRTAARKASLSAASGWAVVTCVAETKVITAFLE